MRSEEAYDFSLFEQRAERRAEKEKASAAPDNVIDLPKKKDGKPARKRLHKHPLRTAAISLGLVFMVGVLGMFVYGQVQLSELAVEISNAGSSLSEQQSLYTQLQMKSDAQRSLSTVERIATQELGMSKMNASQFETVEMNSSDKAEVVQKTAADPLTRAWNRICELLS